MYRWNNLFIAGALLIAPCFVFEACTHAPRVHAQMYLKSKTPQEGYVYHEAEGKQFYIAPVAEQTFLPGEDSYHSMHHHGVAFESQRMAYRLYFDKKQTVDVYAKRTPGLELDAAKWYPTDAQLAEGFGDDILRVSGYIGVGTLKPFDGQKMIHFDDVLRRTQRILTQTRRVAEVEMVDEGWLLPDSSRINLTTRYRIEAGHRDVEVTVLLDSMAVSHLRALYEQRGFTLCTGVQKVGEKCFLFEQTDQAALVGSWGTAWPVNDTVKYAKETCGLGVCVPRKYVLRDAEDKNNRLLLLLPQPVIRYRLTVVSLKENNPPATDAPSFWSFLRRWRQDLHHSLL